MLFDERSFFGAESGKEVVLKTIYIMGAGRSGTTLLDIILGNSKDCISGGEIRWIWRYKGVAPNRVEGRVLDFWKKIYESEVLQSENTKSFDFMESHYMLPWALLLNILRLRVTSYQRYHEELLRRIEQHSSKGVLVDSSKYPSRALLLDYHLKDCTVVYLIRKRADVVRSFVNKSVDQPAKNAISANLYWILMRIACEVSYFFVRSKKVKVEYGALMSDLEVEVAKVCGICGIESLSIIDKLKSNQALDPGFVFQGNRMRLQKEIFINRKHDYV